MDDETPIASPTSVGERLVERLKAGAIGEVAVDDGRTRARATVRGSGPYGSELDEVTVERMAKGDRAATGGRLAEIVEGVARRVDYLGEPLEALEIAPALGRGQLRTRRDRVRGREYFEVDVLDGERIRVARVRGGRMGAERVAVPQNHGHGVLRRLVDDLGELLGAATDDAG